MRKEIIIPSLETINTHSVLKVDNYELPHTKVTPYVVDDSFFIPTSEAIKQLGANSGVQTNLKEYYDFPDGKDSGISVPITRTKNGKDIAEISTHIMESINETSDKISEARNFAKKKAAFDKSIQDIKNMPSSPSPEGGK